MARKIAHMSTKVAVFVKLNLATLIVSPAPVNGLSLNHVPEPRLTLEHGVAVKHKVDSSKLASFQHGTVKPV